MGPRSVNFTEEDKAIIGKVNGLLEQLHVPSRVNAISDIGAGVFVTLFEGLCGEQLPGIIRDASTKEDEIHNCQIVIDSLAGDVLHTTLTHISGAEIIHGNREAILNLTEIFSGLLEYMLNKIDSDASTDNEEDDQNLTTEDPDLMTHDMIDEILEAELKRERLLQDATAVKNAGPTARWVQDSSPSRRAADQSTVSQGETETKDDSQDTTADLIKESEEIERQLRKAADLQARLSSERAKLAAEMGRKSPQAEADVQNGGSNKMASQEKEEQRVPVATGDVEDAGGRRSPGAAQQSSTEDQLCKERERRAEIIQRLEKDPRYKYMLPPTRSQTEAADEEVDETFKSLQNMVEETAAMARAAVNCSPSRAQSLLHTLESVQADRRRPTNTRSSHATGRSVGRPSVGVTERSRRDQARREGRSSTAKRASPSARGVSPKPSDRLSDSELSPSRAKRKVSFLVERSLTDSSPSMNQGQPSPERNLRGIRSGKTTTASGSYLSFEDELGNKENLSYDDRLRKQYSEIVADTFSDDEMSPGKFQTGAKYREQKYKELAGRPRALYTVGDTRKIVQDEQQAGRKKIGFLQKVYREDLDELLDEADYLMDKNREAARLMEKEYRKKVLAGVKTKSSDEKQGPSVLKKKTKKVTPCVSSKVRKSAPSKSLIRAENKPLTIRDDEDILPMLLDEFPHLHLSLHTWHELWRKGLTQIEQITRAHQEVRRKKSQAQNQLEEAERRQEIMVNIMKKELEHSQRLKEIKDRRSAAISTKNKLQERRMQSARSRHYYDEYQVRMRSKMLKRRTREEMIFKKLFKDGLEIQKERIKELRKYAKEQRDGQARVQRNEIESMENYYRDQFNMLAENLAREKKELEIREKAQQKVMGSMKKDLRKKMEKEIKILQEQLVRDDDDAYFRQLDADRVIHDLQLAKYQVTV